MRRASLAVGLVLVLLPGCGHDVVWLDGTPVIADRHVAVGPVRTEARPVSGFRAIEVGGAGQVVVERSGAETLTVTTEEDVLPFVQTAVLGGRLVLGLVPGQSVSSRHGIVFHVGVIDLDTVDASGASRVDARGVDSEAFRVRASGASTVTVAGTCGGLDADVSGASRLLAETLPCREAITGVSGASYARLRVRDRLEARASGASTIEYFGAPVVFVQTSGESVVRPLGAF
jgi:hypothetical protein